MVLEATHVSERSDRFTVPHTGHLGASRDRCSLRRLAAMTDMPANTAKSVPTVVSGPPGIEQELLYRVARGDRPALAQLYAMHASLMLGLAMRILRDKKEAEDLYTMCSWKRGSERASTIPRELQSKGGC